MATFVKGDVVKHRKTGGIYVIVREAKMEVDVTPCYVYELKDNPEDHVWVRPKAEMEEKFDKVSDLPSVNQLDNLDEAIVYAKRVDTFMDNLLEDHKTDEPYQAFQQLIDKLNTVDGCVMHYSGGARNLYYGGVFVFVKKWNDKQFQIRYIDTMEKLQNLDAKYTFVKMERDIPLFEEK